MQSSQLVVAPCLSGPEVHRDLTVVEVVRLGALPLGATQAKTPVGVCSPEGSGCPQQSMEQNGAEPGASSDCPSDLARTWQWGWWMHGGCTILMVAPVRLLASQIVHGSESS